MPFIIKFYIKARYNKNLNNRHVKEINGRFGCWSGSGRKLFLYSFILFAKFTLFQWQVSKIATAYAAQFSDKLGDGHKL